MTGSAARTYPFHTGPGNDLDPDFARLRETAPVSRIRLPYGGDGWLVTRYDDVRQVISDPRFSRAAACGAHTPRMTPEPGSPASILMTDPPEHTRLRRVLAGAFSSRRVAALRPRVAALADGLLAALAELGPPADLVAHLALPLPILVICELLGVPVADRALFRGWVDPILSSTAYRPEQVRTALDEFSDYICDLLDARRTAPGDDLLSALIHAHDEQGRLSELELVTFAGTLLVAGHENTANLIANSAYTLLSTVDLWDRFAAGRARAAADAAAPAVAVEELLRYLAQGTGVSFARIATEPATIAGTVIGAGEAVFVSLPAANRDPRVFDHPETLDLGRADNPHLAFGPGTHHCLGAPLARLELAAALGGLARRFPGLRLAVPDGEVPWKAGLLARAPTALPVAW